MKPVRKAIITAAGRGTRLYPASTTVQKEMFPLVDRDLLTKPTIQIIAEEAIESGIEEICIIIGPGDEEMYRRHFQGMSQDLLPSFDGKEWALEQSRRLGHFEKILQFRVQETQEGYGHAVYCARDFVGDEPVLLLPGDHVYISGESRRCAKQVIDAYMEFGCTVSAVKQTSEELLNLYGTLTGKPLRTLPAVYDVTRIKEKPAIEYAEKYLRTASLRRGLYLCFFGMHVFTPTLFDCLEEMIGKNARERGEFQLTSAQQMVRQRARYVALEVEGERYDMGVPFGYVETQIALALSSPQRDAMLGSLVQIIARSGAALTRNEH